MSDPSALPSLLDAQELITARRTLTEDAAARLRATQEKRARAEARRVKHFEQLGEARRVAAAAKTEVEVNENVKKKADRLQINVL